MADKENLVDLSTSDIAIFATILAASAAIGVFYGFKNRKSEGGIEEYMLGGR